MAQSIISDTEELPIAAHIFEGHLYIKDEKSNRWLWRLFRFDGTSLTCLSSKKNKLPPHTLLDKPCHHNHSISSSRPVSSLTHSASTHSFTSPILATPKHRAHRILASCTETASYDDNNSSNRNSQPIPASYYQLPKWTIEMINIASISLLKPKQKKSKPFKMPTATKPKSFTIRTYDGASFTLKANKQHDLERWIFVLAKMWKFAQVARQMVYNGPRDSIVPQLNQNNAITLAAIGSGSTSNLAYHANDQMTASPILVNQEQQQQQQYNRQLPMKALLKASQVGQSQKHHHDTILSDEKALWIENWVKSLAELEAHTPTESYNDVVDIVTSSPMHVNLSKRTSSRHNYQQPHIHGDTQSLHRPPLISGNHSTSSLPNNATKPKSRKCPTRYNSDYLGYFQDAKTVYTNETSRSIKEESKPSLRYHNSVRAKPIRSHTTGHDIPMPLSATISNAHESLQHGCSPLALLEYKYSQDKQQLPSPPATPAVFRTAGLESDEDVCLADVRKSLQSLEINKLQAEQDLIAKRRSASLMVNASRRDNDW
ncbi:hypothetical protein HMPREF1544_03654 [Mucor circinelloides 1006PhL]|uniref:PH domain-containing protein n=1 Tax=Mucor circinelloides f. circinelloides (strain 1006PhL) TaxID=1220926 RepID=S2KB85_MUCC1|nr:hypothetical protein HMPREF1544_03654 [Mucor circinelloides 1006PhL]KAG1108101.1 hypothetical protein G6F42_016115 [Rhizopus arrhizus]